MTTHLGELELSPADAIHFPKGLPGFDAYRKFVIFQTPDIRPLSYLQSLDLPKIAFLLVPVPLVDPAYRLVIEEADQEVLGGPGAATSLDAHFIVSSHCGSVPTVNMLAPVLICWETRTAVQAVRSVSGYSHAHALGHLFERPPGHESLC